MITLKNLSFTYKNSPAVKNLSAHFKKGRLYCIIGPNGSGKSTLLNMILGRLTPSVGGVDFCGRPLSDYRPRELAEKISLLPQHRNIPEITVEQLIFYGRYPYMGLTKRPTEKDVSAVSLAMEKAKVSHLKGRYLKTLSGGELQRAYLAMLLAQSTDCMLLDEPTSSLDIKGSLSLMKLLKNLAEDGKCIISVLHDLPTALSFADELLVMNKGELIFSGSPKELVESKIITELFGIKILENDIEGQKNYSIYL